MGTIFEEQISKKLIIANGVFTCTYIPGILSTLIYLDKLNSIGKISSIYLVVLLFTAEIIKYAYKRYFTIKWDYNKHKKHVMKSAALIFCSISFYYLLAVLYGAPVLSEHEETLFFSLILTTLTTIHALINLGYKTSESVLMGLTKFDTCSSSSQVILRNIQLTLLGAWSGAVVIPLDWNRPWQKWPIPCSVGAMIGYVIGHLISVLIVLNSYRDKKCNIKKRCV